MSDRSYDTEGGSGGMSVTGFVLGAIVGAGIALLLAPAPGGETRKKLGQTARRLGSRASDLMRHDSEGESVGEPYRSGGRREPMGGGRTPQPGTPGTSA